MKLKPGLGSFYAIEPGNGSGLFSSSCCLHGLQYDYTMATCCHCDSASMTPNVEYSSQLAETDQYDVLAAAG